MPTNLLDLDFRVEKINGSHGVVGSMTTPANIVELELVPREGANSDGDSPTPDGKVIGKLTLYRTPAAVEYMQGLVGLGYGKPIIVRLIAP